ncbi:hypothetical protein RFI_09726, partial [Reticulomyxa filosa]
MSKVRSFFTSFFGRNNEKEKVLLSTPDGSLFHSLILTYNRIFEKSQESEKGQPSNKEKAAVIDTPHLTAPNDNENVSGGHTTNVSEHDPMSILLQILNVAPKLSTEQMEEECIQNDLLQFLKLVSYQFTSHVLSDEELLRIKFRDPHLVTSTSLLSSQDQLGTITNAFNEHGAYATLLHLPLPNPNELKKSRHFGLSQKVPRSMTNAMDGLSEENNPNKTGVQRPSQKTSSWQMGTQTQTQTQTPTPTTVPISSISSVPHAESVQDSSQFPNVTMSDVTSSEVDVDVDNNKDTTAIAIATATATVTTATMTTETIEKQNTMTSTESTNTGKVNSESKIEWKLSRGANRDVSNDTKERSEKKEEAKESKKEENEMNWWTVEQETSYHQKKDMYCRLTNPFQFDTTNPYGALLSLFEQLMVETETAQHFKIKQERVDVLNHVTVLLLCLLSLSYHCMNEGINACYIVYACAYVSSYEYSSPCTVNDRKALQKRDKDLGEHLPILCNRLLRLALEVCKYSSSALELVRSEQMQFLFLTLLLPWTDQQYGEQNSVFSQLTSSTIACILINTFAMVQAIALDDVHLFLHHNQLITF